MRGEREKERSKTFSGMGYILKTSLELSSNDFEKLCDIGDQLYEKRKAAGFLSWVPFYSRLYNDKTIKKKGNKIQAVYAYKWNFDDESDDFKLFKDFLSKVHHKLKTVDEYGDLLETGRF